MSNRPGNKGVRYKEIARDLAQRITGGEFTIGAQIHGRSTLTAYYRVSPETIRRALRLLQDYRVIEVTQGSGIRILSSENAEIYLAQTKKEDDLFLIHDQLRSLVAERDKINQEIDQLYSRIFSYALANVSRMSEIEVKASDTLCGSAIEPIKVWGEKQLYIVSIRRKGETILPHDQGTIQAGDILVSIVR